MSREVLMVEDSSATGAVARKVVESRNANFTVRTTGADGEFYLSGCSAQTIPDLLLLDLNLPDMSGVDLLRRIKADPKLRRIPTCIMAASATEGERGRAYDAGAASFIQVPISHTSLEALLGVVLDYWLNVVQLPPK